MFEMVGFLSFLAVTVVALIATVVSGRKRERRKHLVRALTTTVLLGFAVGFAFSLNNVREFPPDVFAVHKVFSRSVAVLFLPVVLSGWLLWVRPKTRWLHRLFVSLFLLVVAGASVTGVWMLVLSTPK